MIHLQLGQALRRLGKAEEAAVHFAEAERLSADGAETEREQMARYMAGAPEPEAPATSPAVPVIEASPWRIARGVRARSALDAPRDGDAGPRLPQPGRHAGARRALRARRRAVRERRQRSTPTSPRCSPSLGVAYFNARQFQKATAPLARALAASPDDAALKRMLAMA